VPPSCPFAAKPVEVSFFIAVAFPGGGYFALPLSKRIGKRTVSGNDHPVLDHQRTGRQPVEQVTVMAYQKTDSLIVLQR
jgi:hypothetical protein